MVVKVAVVTLDIEVLECCCRARSPDPDPDPVTTIDELTGNVRAEEATGSHDEMGSHAQFLPLGVDPVRETTDHPASAMTLICSTQVCKFACRSVRRSRTKRNKTS